MDTDDTTDDSGHNLMHQTNDEIRIGKMLKAPNMIQISKTPLWVMMKRILRHLIVLFLL